MGIEVWESGESLGLEHAMFQLFVWKDEGSTSPFWLGGHQVDADPSRGPQSKP